MEEGGGDFGVGVEGGLEGQGEGEGQGGGVVEGGEEAVYGVCYDVGLARVAVADGDRSGGHAFHKGCPHCLIQGGGQHDCGAGVEVAQAVGGEQAVAGVGETEAFQFGVVAEFADEGHLDIRGERGIFPGECVEGVDGGGEVFDGVVETCGSHNNQAFAVGGDFLPGGVEVDGEGVGDDCDFLPGEDGGAEGLVALPVADGHQTEVVGGEHPAFGGGDFPAQE